MLRCIQLAKNGLGTTFPNPMVGSIVVHDDKIIGEGFTSAYGGPHAEVNAIASVNDKTLLKKATLYVTLEPCSHFGKTPPCADLIIQHKISKVVIGTMDPNLKVAGKGIKKLKQAGCEVIIGVLEEECKEHHKRFLTFHGKKRPYIILKWAETQDGFIAPEKILRNKNPEPYWITTEESRQLVHKWRSEEQAILVGNTTVLEDNPKLDVRNWSGKSPIRIVLDKNLVLKNNLNVFDQNSSTIILTEVEGNARYAKGIQYRPIDFSTTLAVNICDALAAENIISVIIEGGAKTLQTFIDANLWDEARVFIGDKTFGNGIKSPDLNSELWKSQKIGPDRLNYYRND